MRVDDRKWASVSDVVCGDCGREQVQGRLCRDFEMPTSFGSRFSFSDTGAVTGDTAALDRLPDDLKDFLLGYAKSMFDMRASLEGVW